MYSARCRASAPRPSDLCSMSCEMDRRSDPRAQGQARAAPDIVGGSSSAGRAIGHDAAPMADPEPLLRAAYRAFNARDIEAVLELMQPGGGLAQRLGGRSCGRPRGGPQLLEEAVRGDLKHCRAPTLHERSQTAASRWTSIKSFTTPKPVSSSRNHRPSFLPAQRRNNREDGCAGTERDSPVEVRMTHWDGRGEGRER